MILTDEEQQYLALAAKHLPKTFADGGQVLADDLRESLPDLDDVTLGRVVLHVSNAVSTLIKMTDKGALATTAVAFLDGVALELTRIERGV